MNTKFARYLNYKVHKKRKRKENASLNNKVKKKFKCNICKKRFSREVNPDQHISVVHGKKKSIKCEDCNFRTIHESHFEQHVLKVHEEIKCIKCD